MGASVTECSIEAAVERSDRDSESSGASPRRSAETEADKVRRQQARRRKTKLARHALTASRPR